MSWSLKIMDANGALQSTITDATSPPVMMGSPTCEVDPHGDCVTMTLHGRPDQLTIPTRGILQYEEDGTNLFWGPAVVLPPTGSLGAGPADQDSDSLERFTIAGGKQLVQDSIVEGYFLLKSWLGSGKDVADIAFDLCDRYAHPALTVAAANFPSIGQVLDTYYAPEQQLNDALDKLAQTVAGGAVWYVDAAGSIHFEAA